MILLKISFDKQDLLLETVFANSVPGAPDLPAYLHPLNGLPGNSTEPETRPPTVTAASDSSPFSFDTVPIIEGRISALLSSNLRLAQAKSQLRPESLSPYLLDSF